LSQVTEHYVLIPLGEIALNLDLLLGPSENVSLDDLSQLLQALLGSLFLDSSRPRVATFDNCFAELMFEEVKLAEEPRLHEVEETPKLLQTVLHGSAREDQPVIRMEPHHCLVDKRLAVFDLLRLVQDHVVPSPLSLEPFRLGPQKLV
jgi:hypothetical protein